MTYATSTSSRSERNRRWGSFDDGRAELVGAEGRAQGKLNWRRLAEFMDAVDDAVLLATPAVVTWSTR